MKDVVWIFSDKIALGVTTILKESRIFNMCVISDTGYINTTMQKYNIIEI